jgi:hypothetical protein
MRKICKFGQIRVDSVDESGENRSLRVINKWFVSARANACAI